jgi:hypothetical protein
MHVCLIPFLHQGNKGAVRRAAGHVPSMSLTAYTYLCSSAFDRGSWSKCSSAASTMVVLLLLSSPGLPLAEAALMWSWVSDDQGRDIWRGSFPPHARSQGRPLTSGVNLFLLSWSNEKSMQELYVPIEIRSIQSVQDVKFCLSSESITFLQETFLYPFRFHLQQSMFHIVLLYRSHIMF